MIFANHAERFRKGSDELRLYVSHVQNHIHAEMNLTSALRSPGHGVAALAMGGRQQRLVAGHGTVVPPEYSLTSVPFVYVSHV